MFSSYVRHLPKIGDVKHSLSTHPISVAALVIGALLTTAGGLGTMARASGIGFFAESISALLFGLGIMGTVIAFTAMESRSVSTVRSTIQRDSYRPFEFGYNSFGHVQPPRRRVRVPSWHVPVQELSPQSRR